MVFRAFIAVPIGERPELVEFESALRASGAHLKLVELENIHITLRFLGDTDEKLVDDIKGIMEESVKDIPPFRLKLMGVGAFPSLKYMKVVSEFNNTTTLPNFQIKDYLCYFRIKLCFGKISQISTGFSLLAKRIIASQI